MKIRCTYCGSDKHTQRLCPKTAQGQANRNGMRCHYCGEHNHTSLACPKLGRAEKSRDHFYKD